MVFFFEDNGELSGSKIIEEAFDYIFFQKFQTDGYCDINYLIGKPRIGKQEIEYRLREMHSPLVKLFAESYAKEEKELVEKMPPVLAELGENAETDDFIYFSIVYYILQIYKSVTEKTDAIVACFHKWSKDKEQYKILMSRGIIYDNDRVEIHFISSIENYVAFIDGIRQGQQKLFFRGHNRTSYQLQPSLFRKQEWLKNEKKMYLELLSRCPFEFERLHSHIEKLAEMQHYGLPTRLLDITQNPLVALFFACESEVNFRGEVILFGANRGSIKYSQSDTVALLASLPLFTYQDQENFYNNSCKMQMLGSVCSGAVARLIHEVRTEIPGFVSAVLPQDLQGVTVCIPAKKNRRIDNQEGAFIVCGLVEEIYHPRSGYSTLSQLRVKSKDGKKIICLIEKKPLILKQLDNLGVNKAKIYPEIDDVADYIKTHVAHI